MQPSEEIKAKLDIVEVIRQYTPLKPAGASFLARCPFHNEKSPSFTVSPTKQVWYCFGCGKGGDLFNFIMEAEKLTFPEALRLLAPKAGVTLSREDGPRASQRNKLLDILDQAAGYYHRTFLTHPAAEPARAYLKQRGLGEEMIKGWQIGYAPDSWDDVMLFLRQKGFHENDINLAGLTIRKEGTSRFYNRFRGRVMFPLREVNGNIVGFTARILPQFEGRDMQGKYINSPQTPVYDKSKMLFGLDKAKQAIREQNLAILVEGQMDCLAAQQAGYHNVIASSGTALTEDQVRTLKRFSNRLAFAYDMDKAGKLAVERGAEQAWLGDMETLMITLPDGKDPDECLRLNPEGFKEAVSQPRPAMQYFFDETLSALDLASPSGARRAVESLMPRIAKVINPVERDFWLRRLSQSIGMDERSLRQQFGHFIDAAKFSSREMDTPRSPGGLSEQARGNFSAAPATPVGRPEILSEQLVSLLLKYPVFIDSVARRLPLEQIAGAQNQALYKFLVIYYNKNIASNPAQNSGDSFNYSSLRAWLNDYGQVPAGDIQAFDRLALLVEKNFFETSFEEAESLVSATIRELRHYYLSSRLKVVTRLMFELESKKQRPPAEEERLNALLKEFNALAEEIRQLSVA